MTESRDYSLDEQDQFLSNFFKDGTPPPLDAGVVRGNSFTLGHNPEHVSQFQPIVVEEVLPNEPAVEKTFARVDDAIRELNKDKHPEKQPEANQPKRGLITVFSSVLGNRF